MTETLAAEEVSADIPEYPMDRDGRCPFAPPPQMLEMGKPRRCPGCGSGTAARRGSSPATRWRGTLFADSRVSVDDRRDGFPHWNEHMLSTVNKRPRSVFTSDAEEHTRFRRMLSKPFTFKRVEAPALRRSKRSPTSASTRSWPARSPPTSSRSSRCRCPPW